MNKIITYFLLLFITLSPCFGQQDVVLRVDPKTHMNKINDLISTRDKKQLISCSADKTIRIWDFKQKKEVRKIIGQIGDGDFGKYYAITLSADEKYLFAAGCLGKEYSKDSGNIRVFDFKTGKLLQNLVFHQDKVIDLAMSKDGCYLVSGSHDKQVAIWDIKNNFKKVQHFSEHTDFVYVVDIFKYKNDYRIVSAGLDRMLFLYSLKQGKKITEYKAYDDIDSLVISENKELIACNDWTGFLYVFDFNLKRLKKITGDFSPYMLAFSPDGRYLLSGNAQSPYFCPVYDMENNYKKIAAFTDFNDLLYSACFIDNKQVVLAGGVDNRLVLWDIATGNSQVLTKAEPPITNIGINGDTIYIGYNNSANTAVFHKTFNLQDFNIITDKDKIINNNIKQIEKTYQDYKLSAHTIEQAYNSRLVIKKQDVYLTSIQRDAQNGYSHTIYGFTEGGTVISGGHNGYLAAYSINGKLLTELKGHEGAIISLATEGERLLSAAEDQTIRIWDLTLIKQGKKVIHPLLTLYMRDDNEWILFSNSGFYCSSLKGDRYVGFHINRGMEREALFFNSEKFFDHFYRPDIIAGIIKYRNQEKAIQALKNLKPVQEIKIGDIVPPTVILKNDQSYIQTKADSINIDFSVEKQSDFDITDVLLLLNGRPVAEKSIRDTLNRNKYKSLINFQEKLPLTQEKNIITIIAKNMFASSNPRQITIEKQIAFKDRDKPNLYILSIGVSRYLNPEINLEYADKDAQAILDIMQKQKGKAYKTIQNKLLINQNATRSNITGALAWLQENVTEKDTVIIFIAGHGTNDNAGNYYYLSHEVALDNLTQSAVPWVEFKKTVTSLPGKVIFIIDTCHSGNIWGKLSREKLQLNSAVKSIAAFGTGQIIMTAATTDDSSYEDPEWGHGAFTYAIINALDKNMADFDANGEITMKEFDFYVTMKVKELTEGIQVPTTIIPDSIPDFSISRK